jgi:hypothetical protein
MNPLDGCLHVYLDVGSNRGIQVRRTQLYVYLQYIDEGVLGSGMRLFLIGGHWPKILPQNSKDVAKCVSCVCVLCMVYTFLPCTRYDGTGGGRGKRNGRATKFNKLYK